MVQAGAGPTSTPWDRGPRALLLVALLLVPASVLAGCVAEPSTELTLRRGDLVRAELVLAGHRIELPADARNASSLEALCGHDPVERPEAGCSEALATYSLSSTPPARLPDRWADAAPLPGPVVEALSGRTEGEHVVRETFLAYGEHDPDLVERHPRTDAIPRLVDASPAYGRSWETTQAANGTVRLEPGASDQGASLEVPRWCNDRFCLFESRLVDWNATHLIVQHGAEAGDQVHVQELDTWLTVTDANATRFTVDGNDPRAGERFTLYARILEARGPPEGTRRAPGFALTTIDGSTVELSELLGRPVVLEFFATWCPSCIKNTEHLNRLEVRFGERVQILSIGVDPWEKPAAIESFVRQNDVSWPVAVDQQGRVSQAYHVGSLSHEVVVSPDGAIVHVETGVADHERVAGVIEGLLDAANSTSEADQTRQPSPGGGTQ